MITVMTMTVINASAITTSIIGIITSLTLVKIAHGIFIQSNSAAPIGTGNKRKSVKGSDTGTGVTTTQTRFCRSIFARTLAAAAATWIQIAVTPWCFYL